MSRYADLEASIVAVYAADAPLLALAPTIAVKPMRPEEMDVIDWLQINPVILPAVLVDADMEPGRVETASFSSIDYFAPVTVQSIVSHTVQATAKTLLDAIVTKVEDIANLNCNSVNDWSGAGWVTVDGAYTTMKMRQVTGGFVAIATTTFNITKNILVP